jgi:hypothetical protein
MSVLQKALEAAQGPPPDQEVIERLKHIMAECDPIELVWNQADPNAVTWRLRDGVTSSYRASIMLFAGRYAELENPPANGIFNAGAFVRIITKESTAQGVSILLQGVRQGVDENGNPIDVGLVERYYDVSIGMGGTD